jgi:pimeloyl-ACP methyl ester carboxylesterase
VPFAELDDGLSMYYESQGDGPGEPIVWIAGTGQPGRVWNAFQVPAFADRHRCVTMDLRGAGRTDAPDGPYSIAAMAKDVESLLTCLGVGPAHFVGYSMGSAILQELALAAPRLVLSAVMWNSWSCTRLEHHIRRHFQARVMQLEQASLEVFRAASFWAWAPSFVEDEPDRMAELEALLAEAGGIEIEPWLHQWRADLDHDTLDRLPGIRCPTLVLYGAEDLITLPRYHVRIAEAIPNAELRAIEGGGHMVFYERPSESNAAIRDFLDRVSAREASG